jgi:hypothetical protein
LKKYIKYTSEEPPGKALHAFAGIFRSDGGGIAIGKRTASRAGRDHSSTTGAAAKKAVRCDEPFGPDDGTGNLNKWVIGH